jgi:hypothetical protein
MMMGSSVEGLKLRRMRVRNDISFNRNAGGGPERTEDLEALREELRELSKQIEEAEHNSSIPPDNQAPFASPQAAELAGYRSAHNCP